LQSELGSRTSRTIGESSVSGSIPGGPSPADPRSVGLGVVPSLVQLALFHRLPESPRVLILRGEDERARAVLSKIYSTAGPEVIELKLQVIKNHIELTTRLQRTSTFKERTGKLWTHKPYRRSIFTVCLIQVFGQFTGYNTLLYYAGDLFGLLGLENAAIGGLIPSITNTFFLLCGMVMVDRIGRRGLLMKLGPIMVVGLLWCLISFYCECSGIVPRVVGSQRAVMCKPTGGFLVTGFAYSQTLVGMVIAGIVIFCVGFGSTYAHLCWYQSEYLALEIRAVGSAISTTASFSANLVVAVTFLSELETLTPAGTYGLYLGFIIIGLVLAYYCYPETSEWLWLILACFLADVSQRSSPWTRPSVCSTTGGVSRSRSRCAKRRRRPANDSTRTGAVRLGTRPRLRLPTSRRFRAAMIPDGG
jgi:SP family myo-inositol transporter-like MFS transporter 13